MIDSQLHRTMTIPVLDAVRSRSFRCRLVFEVTILRVPSQILMINRSIYLHDSIRQQILGIRSTSSSAEVAAPRYQRTKY